MTSFNKAAVQTLEVLASFADGAQSVGVTELSRKLDITKNKAFRALQTLLEHELVVRTSDGSRYELGYRVFELQNPHFNSPDLLTLAIPFMERIQETLGETVILSVLASDRMVVIHGIEGSNKIVRRIPLGMAVPLHASAGSRSVLAFLSDEEIESYLARNTPLSQITERTLTDTQKLWDEVKAVRERGFAFGFGDYLSDVTSIAFPLFDAESKAFATIAAGGPSARVSFEMLSESATQLSEVIAELNELTKLFIYPHSADFWKSGT